MANETYKTVDLNTWEQFEAKLALLQADTAHRADARLQFLYRGQGSDRWGITTTLERRSDSQPSWSEYASLVHATLPAVETLTNRNWHAPTYEELAKWGSDYEQGRKAPPGYDYYVYLRHHGFPSPLLDWSRSAYVAAFFAFRAPTGDRVAIFSYLDNVGRGKVGSSSRPKILHLGPYVRSHPRHVLQQCEYTMCSQFTSDQWTFVRHDDVFAFGERDQDLVWKFTLPASERLKVLKRLDEYNLNAYSLFPTEDALLETVALREIEFRERSWLSAQARA